MNSSRLTLAQLTLTQLTLTTIDCDYLFPRFAASYLRIQRQTSGDSAIFIETNTTHSVPLLLEELRKNNLTPEQVQYVIVTHAHLDHSGGASALLKACPNAILLVHPKAAPHLIDPSRLVASARVVYGNEAFEKLYGTIDPIPSERVRAMGDGEKIIAGSLDSPGSTELEFLHTRGHAPHHFCIYDRALEAVFTGDTFGLAYPDLQKKGLFIFPSTSPTGFEPEEAIKSVDRILATGATRVFLTHFGEVTDLAHAAQQLKADLQFSGDLMRKAAASSLMDSELDAFCEEGLMKYFHERLEKLSLAGDSQIWDILKLDLNLNAVGIAVAAKRMRA